MSLSQFNHNEIKNIAKQVNTKIRAEHKLKVKAAVKKLREESKERIKRIKAKFAEQLKKKLIPIARSSKKKLIEHLGKHSDKVQGLTPQAPAPKKEKPKPAATSKGAKSKAKDPHDRDWETPIEPSVISDIKEELESKPELELPENVEKLVSFMKETGGNIEDYVRLNADYSNIKDDILLNEYYKKTRPHLDPEEVKFLMEDNFSYDEDMDEERDVRRKKLAYKEEIAKAKTFLEETKKKY